MADPERKKRRGRLTGADVPPSDFTVQVIGATSAVDEAVALSGDLEPGQQVGLDRGQETGAARPDSGRRRTQGPKAPRTDGNGGRKIA